MLKVPCIHFMEQRGELSGFFHPCHQGCCGHCPVSCAEVSGMELEVSMFAGNLFLGVTFVPLAKPLGIEPIHSGIVPGLKRAFFRIDEC